MPSQNSTQSLPWCFSARKLCLFTDLFALSQCDLYFLPLFFRRKIHLDFQCIFTSYISVHVWYLEGLCEAHETRPTLRIRTNSTWCLWKRNHGQLPGGKSFSDLFQFLFCNNHASDWKIWTNNCLIQNPFLNTFRIHVAELSMVFSSQTFVGHGFSVENSSIQNSFRLLPLMFEK